MSGQGTTVSPEARPRRDNDQAHIATVNAQQAGSHPAAAPCWAWLPLDSQALFALWTMVMLPALGKNVLSCPSSHRTR